MTGNDRNPNSRRPSNKAPGKSVSEREVYKSAPSRYRKRRSGVNMALVLITVLLTAALAASVIHIAKLSKSAIDDRRDSIEEAINSEKDTMSPKPQVEMITVTASAEEVHRGDLILVNYENPYVFPEDESELVTVYEHMSDDYRVAYNTFLLDRDVMDVFNDFAAALREAAGERCLLINSTYRSYADQELTYNNYVTDYGEEAAREYVSDPGYSEHHTGLAMDLTILLDDGTYQKMADYEHYDVINTICVEYGFIHRYPATKEGYTHIAHEPWHYRYVGVPHSYVISKEKYCLEEYITLTKDYTLDGKLLSIDASGTVGECTVDTMPETGYVIYYVPAGETETELKIPAAADSYSVSGNNSDGFVISVRFGELTLPESSFAVVG